MKTSMTSKYEDGEEMMATITSAGWGTGRGTQSLGKGGAGRLKKYVAEYCKKKGQTASQQKTSILNIMNAELMFTRYKLEKSQPGATCGCWSDQDWEYVWVSCAYIEYICLELHIVIHCKCLLHTVRQWTHGCKKSHGEISRCSSEKKEKPW